MVEDSEVSKRILSVEEEDRYVSFNAKSSWTSWCKILSVKMIFFLPNFKLIIIRNGRRLVASCCGWGGEGGYGCVMVKQRESSSGQIWRNIFQDLICNHSEEEIIDIIF